MNKKYLTYLFKSRKSLCVVVFALYLLAFITCTTATGFKSAKYAVDLLGISLVLGILTYVLVPIVFSFVHDKKAVDSYFSLPVTRKEMINTSLLFIYIVILVPFIILSIVCFFIGISSHGINSFFAYLGYQLIAIIGVCLIVLFNTNLYIVTNSSFDGVVMMLAYGIMPFIFMFAIDLFLGSCIAGIKVNDINFITSFISLPSALITYLFTRGEMFIGAIHDLKDSAFLLWPGIKFVICAIWHFLVSIICIRRNFIERKTERAGSVSNRFFSYPFVIYAYTFLLVLGLTVSFYHDLDEAIILYALLFVCYMVANFVYQRNIKLKLKHILYFVITIVISLGISLVGFKTRGFGLAYSYDLNPANMAFDYDSYMTDDFDSKLGKLIKEKYPDSLAYEITVMGKIDSKDMKANSNIHNLFEEKRNAAIDNFYNNIDGGACLIITTNYEENAFNNAARIINNDSSKYYSRYYHAPYLTYEEILSLDKLSEIYVDIETPGKYIQVNFDSLLEN